MLNFTTTRVEEDAVNQIADRAQELGLVVTDRLSFTMDLSATHSNGCPLDFNKLLNAPDFDFAHDVCGIQRHMDRQTGQLTDCFLPRCAAVSA